MSEGEDQGPGEGAENGAESITERVAAILAADAVGYSRLMADDEQATVKALDKARDVFRRHVEANRGRVVDTAGDSVLAVFETTSGAVRASVAIQEGLHELNADTPTERQMQFRIGIHLGDIMEKPSDGTIYGDGVNVAARLEALSEPGGITVSDSVHGSIRDRLDVGFAFLGEHEGKNLKTPVKAYRVLAEGEEPEKTTGKLRIQLMGVIAAGIAAIVIVAGVVWWQVQEPEPPQMVTADGTPTDDPILAMPQGPTIAVLPFDNMSGDPSQSYFSDGLTEQIIAGLARFRDLFVIARNTTFQFKGRASDVRDIANELGVRFVLEGSVHKSDDFVRVTAQLIDGASGSHVWADSYDRELTAATVFAIQNEITEQVVATLAGGSGVLVRQIGREMKTAETNSLDAFECVMLVSEFWNVTFTPENHLVVTECLEEAMETTPDYVDGWANLALLHLFAGYGAELNSGDDYLERGIEAARRAVQLDPTSQMARRSLAVASYFSGDIEKFKIEAEAAIAINPNDADALAELGQLLAFTGEWDRGFALTQKAIKLNPYYPDWVIFTLAKYHLVKGDMAAAVEAAKRINMPDYWVASLTQAYVYASAGRQADAEAAVATILELRPDATIALARKLYQFYQFQPSYIDAFVVRGLRKAGLPEEAQAPSRPVIAVLPFDNLSGDIEQEYFADGITEDIITRLAQYPDILVLGRNTTFQFKGDAVDIPTIAEKLGADYVVEGSIRRGGDTVRVTAQLLAAEGGTHLWAETFDRALDTENLFAIQDEVTASIASLIGDPYGEIGQEEVRRSERHAPRHVSSYECVLKYFDYNFHMIPDSFIGARDCLEKVVEMEPDYAVAMAYLGTMYIDEVAFGFDPSGDATLKQALRIFEQAAALEPRSGLVRVHLARGLLMTNDLDRAIREANEALSLASNNLEVLANAITIFAYTGDYERVNALMGKIARLNPNFPPWLNWMPAYAHLARGEYLEAVALLEMTQMGWQDWTNAFIAAAHCLNGDIADGKASLEIALAIDPKLTETYWSEFYFWQKGPGARPLIDAVASGLEACGWDVPPDPGPEAFAN